jgi:hypothetical protein
MPHLGPVSRRALAGMLALLISPTALAVDFVVNNNTDATLGGSIVCTTTASNNCTLRAAIQAANNNPGADTIDLGTFDLTLQLSGSSENGAATGDLDVIEDLTIIGNKIGSRNIIDANLLDRVFHVLSGKLTLQHVSVTGGYVGIDLTTPTPNTEKDKRYGGGIYVQGSSTLVLSDVEVTGNEVWVIGDNNSLEMVGGGIYVDTGTVTSSNTVSYATAFIENSEITNNIAPSGGGIGNAGRADIRTTLIDGNTSTGSTAALTAIETDASINGGGIANLGGYLTLGNSTVSNNVSAATGGGLYIFNRGLNLGNVIITNTTVSDNEAKLNGGGIAAYAAPLSINNSTISGNFITTNSLGYKGSGGGIFNSGSLDVINSTISGNSGANSGGGIFNTSDLSLTNVTLYDNNALRCVACGTNGVLGGNELTVYHSSSDTGATPNVVLANTIIADGTGSEVTEPVCAGGAGYSAYINSIGHNIETGSGGTTCNLSALVNDQIITNAALNLGPLAKDLTYPGTQAVHPLLLPSLAKDAGLQTYCPNVDQRFLLRSDGLCDVGAYEYNASSTSGDSRVDLKATITDSPDQVKALKEQLTYKVTVSNLYVDTSATAVVVNVTLPSTYSFINLTYASTTVDPVCSAPTMPSNIVSCTISTLPGLGRVEFFITGVATEVGIISARVDVYNASPPDTFAQNNTKITVDTVVTHDNDDTTNYGSTGRGGGGGSPHPLTLLLAALLLAHRRIRN